MLEMETNKHRTLFKGVALKLPKCESDRNRVFSVMGPVLHVKNNQVLWDSYNALIPQVANNIHKQYVNS